MAGEIVSLNKYQYRKIKDKVVSLLKYPRLQIITKSFQNKIIEKAV